MIVTIITSQQVSRLVCKHITVIIVFYCYYITVIVVLNMKYTVEANLNVMVEVIRCCLH